MNADGVMEFCKVLGVGRLFDCLFCMTVSSTFVHFGLSVWKCLAMSGIYGNFAALIMNK